MNNELKFVLRPTFAFKTASKQGKLLSMSSHGKSSHGPGWLSCGNGESRWQSWTCSSSDHGQWGRSASWSWDYNNSHSMTTSHSWQWDHSDSWSWDHNSSHSHGHCHTRMCETWHGHDPRDWSRAICDLQSHDTWQRRDNSFWSSDHSGACHGQDDVVIFPLILQCIQPLRT
jgi:hypothetical protein